ncbi:MAG TPA: FxsA family protein [Pseudonocardiaceae bacterium]|nr:FxsA family protein [Pseudonocardiaceae bacterium]
MVILLILLVAAIIELAVLIAVGNAIGVLATIGLLILASLVGAALLRREGIRTLVAFREALRTRRPPHRELIDGMLIATAGVFIVLPGFVSDVLGLLLLLPPTRALVRRRMMRSAGLRTTAGLYTTGPQTPVRFAPGAVVEGEVVDEPPAPRPGHELR